MIKSHEYLFRDQIKVLASSDWKIVFEPSVWTTKIVNERGEEIDGQTLGFITAEIQDYLKKKEEDLLGERRKVPLDEFTRKRRGIEDYILISDESNDVNSTVFEAYHDDNKIFCIEKFGVSKRNNLLYDEFSVYLNVDEAEKLLISLQSYVDKNKKNTKE